jgi:hypothetical protein
MGGLGFGQGYFGQYATGGLTPPEFVVVLFTTEAYASPSATGQTYATGDGFDDETYTPET